ncbi:cytochrome P450 6B4-like [Leguminivora glycinivorella]|uniref:cytochrome P450 6B4-like n=1 Tax=Leguminivora glycinivorella TaxID=1035111 RepID=UPI00200E2F00|nr:cytochrome P450 6B4-like [Leguminivora glycinivorella]
MALAFILIATVGYCLYRFFTRNFNYWRDRNVAGPTPIPLFGNIKESVLRRKIIGAVYQKIYYDFPQEKIVGVYKMTSPCLLIRDPDIVKQVLVKDFDIFADRVLWSGKEALAMNLLSAPANTWRILRYKFTPLFTSAKLKNMFPLINETSDKFIRFLEKVTQTQPEQEVKALMSKFTMMNIGTCAFGLDLDMTEKCEATEFLEKINEMIFTTRYTDEINMLFPGIFIKIGVPIFPTEITKFFKNLVTQVMTARKGTPSDKNDFMDLLLEMKQLHTVQGRKRSEEEDIESLEITEDLMAAQAFVFYAAGFDTSATRMSYMLYQLALNPEIQDRLVKEIQEVVERHGGKITYDALNDLTYFERVLNETLRINSQGVLINRVAVADYKIPGTHVTLEKGQQVVISLSSLHSDEKYWTDPARFDPDRFTPDNVAKRHPAGYLPFGMGPRGCIGARFAKVQMQVAMMKILLMFKVEATENTRKEFHYDPYRALTFPVGGIKINFIPRQ